MHTYFRFIKRTPSAESGSTHALSFMYIFSKNEYGQHMLLNINFLK